MHANMMQGRKDAAGNSGSPLSTPMIFLFALSCGLIAASNYFIQPLIQIIGPDIGLPGWAGGLLVTLGQIGFCAGLLVIAPIGDLAENRRLILATLIVLVAGVALLGFADMPVIFLVAALVVGIASATVQILVAFAAHISPPAARGHVVGCITAGLLTGILLARPFASLMTDHFGWRSVFMVDTGILAGLAILLAVVLPRHHPATTNPAYADMPPDDTVAMAPKSPVGRWLLLVVSQIDLMRRHAALRRLGFIQACLFGIFSLFWTASPLALHDRFGLSQTAIAIFALAGAGGAIAAPLAGRMADHGRASLIRRVGMAMILTGFCLTLVHNIWLWTAAGIILDAGVQFCHVTAQRRILGLDAMARGRINGLYIACFFAGGAICSLFSAMLYVAGWCYVVAAAIVLVVLAIWAERGGPVTAD